MQSGVDGVPGLFSVVADVVPGTRGAMPGVHSGVPGMPVGVTGVHADVALPVGLGSLYNVNNIPRIRTARIGRSLPALRPPRRRKLRTALQVWYQSAIDWAENRSIDCRWVVAGHVVLRGPQGAATKPNLPAVLGTRGDRWTPPGIS